MSAVSDSGPLIHLSWIDKIEFLATLFEEVVIPAAVRDEIMAGREGTPGLDRLRRALLGGELIVEELHDSWNAGARRRGRGESEAILLAERSHADFVLTDDLSARLAARRRGLTVMGTLGILSAARDAGLIPAALPFVEELRRRGQWLSDELVRAVAEQEAGGKA